MPPEPTAQERAEDLIRRLYDACYEVTKLPNASGFSAWTIAQAGEVLGEMWVHPPYEEEHHSGAIVLTRDGHTREYSNTRGWGRVFDLLERHLITGRDRFYA